MQRAMGLVSIGGAHANKEANTGMQARGVIINGLTTTCVTSISIIRDQAGGDCSAADFPGLHAQLTAD